MITSTSSPICHSIETFPNGSYSMKNLTLGECMHSSIGPWREAEWIYIQQSQLWEHLEEVSLEEPLPKTPASLKIPNQEIRTDGIEVTYVVYDVGLGIAANALALLETLQKPPEELKIQNPVKILMVSFEQDLSGLLLALDYSAKNPAAFPFLLKHPSEMKKLLAQGSIEIPISSRIELQWVLKQGDFREKIEECPPADLIFFDLYSPKSCPGLWGYSTFQRLRNKTHLNSKAESRTPRATRLITYSASTAARAALLLNGFFVGRGLATSGKRETTVASTRASDLKNPLDLRWFEHWKRSSSPLPSDLPLNLKLNSSSLIREALGLTTKGSLPD